MRTSAKSLSTQLGTGLIASDRGFQKEINADFVLMGERGNTGEILIAVIDGVGNEGFIPAKLLADRLQKDNDCLVTTLEQVHDKISSTDSGACLSLVLVHKQLKKVSPCYNRKVWDWASNRALQKNEVFVSIIQAGDTQALIYDPFDLWGDRITFDTACPPEQMSMVEQSVLKHSITDIKKAEKLNQLLLGTDQPDSPFSQPKINIGTYLWAMGKLQQSKKQSTLFNQAIDQFCKIPVKSHTTHTLRRDIVWDCIGNPECKFRYYLNYPIKEGSFIMLHTDGIGDQFTSLEYARILTRLKEQGRLAVNEIFHKLSYLSDLQSNVFRQNAILEHELPYVVNTYFNPIRPYSIHVRIPNLKTSLEAWRAAEGTIYGLAPHYSKTAQDFIMPKKNDNRGIALFQLNLL
ncbi:hypothetical protein [Endozoicomonas sp. Mp262]|uniref:hypothetical protein n=1 Tax=Endozoicomonas sp. Mp262 TaxID=2919499 RepID=UPI0021DA68BF